MYPNKCVSHKFTQTNERAKYMLTTEKGRNESRGVTKSERVERIGKRN